MKLHEQIARKKQITPHSKLEGVKIPESTESELIIPCRLTYYGFIKMEENREHWQSIRTKKINETINQLNKSIDIILIEKKLEESRDYQGTKLLALKVLFSIGIVTSFVMYLLVLFDVGDFKEKFIFIPLSIIIAVVVASMGVMVKGLLTERRRVDVDAKISEAVDRILEQENKSFYNPAGFVIERQEKLFWLSLKNVFNLQ